MMIRKVSRRGISMCCLVSDMLVLVLGIGNLMAGLCGHVKWELSKG
jgi:hypothetical protein